MSDTMQPGSMIGDRHRVVRLLGKGGMGAVYEAENTWTTRRVAIKVLLPMFSSDPTAVARFKGEAQAATRLAHPNIVDVLDMGEDPATGGLYIVQEFLRGRDLHAHLEERKQLSPSQAAEILVPVIGALALAHERNIIHRDLKPENIFLVSNGPQVVPKLIDFGLSKVLGEDDANRKTVTGTVMGTPYYMSPEQARGDRTVDARTDIWAMGVVLFEMVTGGLPFQADSTTMILLKIISAPPPRVEDVAPEVPREVAAIIHRAMEPDLAKRYPTLREMLNDVLACHWFQNPDERSTLRERFVRSIEHEPPTNSEALIGAASTMLASPSTPAAAPPRARSTPSAQDADRSTFEAWQAQRDAATSSRPRRAAVGAAALALVVMVGAAAVYLSGTPSTPASATAAAMVRGPQASPVPAPPIAAPPVAAPMIPAVAAAPAPATDAGAVAETQATPGTRSVDPPQRPSRSSRHRRHRRDDDALAPVAPR